MPPSCINCSSISSAVASLAHRGFSGSTIQAARSCRTFLARCHRSWAGSLILLAAAARLLGALHDATAESSLRGHAEVVCHGDASPCNTAFHEGIPSAFIDFDAAHPGTRWEDVGYAAWLWLDLGNADLSPKLQATRLGGFMRAYGGGWHEDAVLAVLDAQEALAARPAAPEAVRIWAETCRAWTFSHQSTLAHEARVADSPATRGEDSE